MAVRNVSVPRPALELPMEGFFYLHGVSALDPLERPAVAPFAMEEKGVDGRNFIVAWDHSRLRYYVSVVSGAGIAIGRDDILLLSKQDSIKLRGIHESILNDLRLHGTVLPFGCGTVVAGWRELQRRLTEQSERDARALQSLQATKWWTVSVSALDARFAELQVHDTLEKRRQADRYRDSYSTPPPASRIDVRALERILMKQRRLAESIHAVLEPVADHAKVLSMVSLQSRTSDDWKIILKTSYEIRPSILTRFQRQVTDLQYQYLLQELMIALSGDVEKTTLAPAP